MKANFPEEDVKIYTFGQPRTGNAPYAELVEETVGLSNIFRGMRDCSIVVSGKANYFPSSCAHIW